MSDQKIFKPEDFEKPKPSKTSKAPKIALGILVVALLGAGGYFLLNESNGEVQEEQPTAQVVLGDSTSAEKDTTTTDVTAQDKAHTDSTSEERNGTQASDYGDEDVAAPTPKAGQNETEKPAVAAVTGDVDELARNVIRGDYGNGQVRKDRLGAEYQTIQDKVNEMYRNGLVR